VTIINDAVAYTSTALRVSFFLWLVAAYIIVVTGLLGALSWCALRMTGIRVSFDGFIALASGMIIVAISSWYSISLTGSTKDGFIAIACISIAAFVFNIFYCPRQFRECVSAILSTITKNMAVVFFIAISLMFFSVFEAAWMRIGDLPLLSMDNNDVFLYIKVADAISLGPTKGNNIAGINLLEYSKAGPFGVYAYLAFSSFITGYDVLDVAPAVMVSATASIAGVAFFTCYRLLRLPITVAYPLSFLSQCSRLSAYVIFQFFIAQIIYIGVFFGLVMTLLYNFNNASRADRYFFSTDAACRVTIACGAILLYYQALYFVSFFLIIVFVGVLFGVKRLGGDTWKWQVALGGVARFLGLTCLVHLAVVPERTISVVQHAMFFAYKDVAGWPLGFVSTGAIFSLPNFWRDDQTETFWFSVLSVALLCALVVLVLKLLTAKHSISSQTVLPTVVLLVFLLVLTASYIMMWAVFGYSYQQWKFASTYPVSLGYVFIGSIILFALRRFDGATSTITHGVAAFVAICLVTLNVKDSASALFPRIVHYAKEVRGVSAVDAMEDYSNIVIDTNRLSEKMLIATMIQVKQLSFTGPTYYGSGSPDALSRLDRTLLIQNRGPCAASQLSISSGKEFIVRRDNSGVPLGEGRLSFSRALGPCLSVVGFHPLESWGRWIDGTHATISFQCDCHPRKDYYIGIRVVPFIMEPLVTRQSLTIVANGQSVGTWVLETHTAHDIVFPVPGDGAAEERVDIELSVPTAVSPASVGGRDARVIGIGIQDMRIGRVASERR